MEQHHFIAAIFRLDKARSAYPELARAEAQARLMLAEAIMEWDEKRFEVEAAKDRGDNPRPHDLYEQAAVNSALKAYGDALAALVRGEESDDPDS